MSFLVTVTREGVTFDAWECKDKAAQEAKFIELCKTNGVPASPIDIQGEYKSLKFGGGTICMIETRMA